MLGATRKTADEFFGNLARELGAADTAPEEAADPAPGVQRRYGAIGALIAILLILWFLLG